MNNGFAIALAWPETLCKQTGAWYEGIMEGLNFNKNGYYKVGHAAIVLVDDKSKSCHYFDFGRYHAPAGFGRVRSAQTDFDLSIKTTAIYEGGDTDISNLDCILEELYRNPSTHGTGQIFAAPVRIDFDSALAFIHELQEEEFIAYGPFVPRGTNCSRFVNSALRSGRLTLRNHIALQFPATISPTPMWNVMSLRENVYRFEETKQEKLVWQTAE